MQNIKINTENQSEKEMIDTIVIQLTGECTINVKDVATTLRKETEKRKRIYPE